MGEAPPLPPTLSRVHAPPTPSAPHALHSSEHAAAERDRPPPPRASGTDSKLHRPSRARCARRAAQAAAAALVLALCALVLLRSAWAVVGAFHWAERRVHRDSRWHMLLAFAAMLPFSLGAPIPIVHQAWAVAIGCFFRWKAFPILLASLAVGVPLPFAIGRKLARGGDSSTMEARLRAVAPRAVAYLSPLRKAISDKPIRSSFLLMWAPLPTSFLPLLLGLVMAPEDLSLLHFVLGALPSKLLHFACDVLVGLEAGSLAAALDAHDDFPGMDDLDDLEGLASSRRRARRIAIGVMALAVLFMLVMLRTMHTALRDLKATHEGHEDEKEHKKWREASSYFSPV
ncbi:hypothetical protein AB1Y20_008731 [Prymnesium parvum]|uniref:Golgi apparatus membrane protein TVP38 n=1 Tax=Prymnesium parvum TaxID=97485 RepID=A0AB34IT93_PRYPA